MRYMKRLRQVLLGVIVAAYAAAPRFAQSADPTTPPATHPNVLFITLDDLNHWVGHLDRNRQAKTPNIDRLASRGESFSHAYCAAPLCNPSRAAFMSGLRPHVTGIYQNDQDWRPAIPEELSLTTTFRNAGYYVAGSGKIYHGGFPRRSEWDDYESNTGSDPHPVGDGGVGGIRFAPLDCKDEDLREWKIVNFGIEELKKKHDKPFFLAIGLNKPHMPWNVPRKYFDLYPLEQIELPPHRENDLVDLSEAAVKMAGPDGDHAAILASGRWKDAIQAYLAAISYADAMVGRLLDALDESEYSRNTIIVLLGDHGWHLGEKEHWRKFALWEEATRAPLIWLAPGVTKPGTISTRPVDFMSIYPTLTDLAGIPTPKHVDGKSLRPLLVDPRHAWDQPALTTYGRGNHAIRTEKWRYIKYADGSDELYDETADPYEWDNLAGKTEFKSQKADLAKLLPPTDAPDVVTPHRSVKNRNGQSIGD